MRWTLCYILILVKKLIPIVRGLCVTLLGKVGILLVICLNCYCEASTSSHKVTLTAASPSFTDVSASIAIARPGDTVIVPAGSAIWNSSLIITKGIKLIGAGIGQTIITGGFSAGTNYFTNSGYMVVYEPSNPEANEPFRLSGFTFDGGGNCHWLKLSNRPTSTPIYIPRKIRIDHNRVLNTKLELGIMIFGELYGVADNNEFVGARSRHLGLDELAWRNLTFSYGTADNFYFEDNVYNLGGKELAYAEAGARYCIRHNTINLTAQDLFSLHDAHGNNPGAWSGTMGLEIYANAIDAHGNYLSVADHRGGKGLIYDNTVSNTTPTYIEVREEFFDYDGPGPAKNSISGQPQYVSESYYWNNQLNGALIPVNIPPGIYPNGGTLDYGGELGIVPQFDRDCWKQSAAFNGTSGIGYGPLSSRPTTCTKGVAYWATDTKTLYRCIATNTWEDYYKPYTYPHPLRTELSGQ